MLADYVSANNQYVYTLRSHKLRSILQEYWLVLEKEFNLNIFRKNEAIIQLQKYLPFPELNNQAVLRGKYGPQKTVCS